MTFFLDGPPSPARSADKIPSKAPVATPETGARQAPEPSGLTGIPVAPKKPAPTAERQRRNTRMAALRAAALRVAERRELEVEQAATAATATATAAPEEPEDELVEDTATSTPTTAAPAAAMEDEMAANHTSGQGGSERIRDALRSAYPGSVSLDDLVEAYGGPRTAARTRINQMARGGDIKKLEGQMYRWAGALDQEQERPRRAPRRRQEEAAEAQGDAESSAEQEQVEDKDEVEDEDKDEDEDEDEDEDSAEDEQPDEAQALPEPELDQPARPRAQPTDLMEEASCRMDEAQRLIGLALSELALGRAAMRRLPYRVNGEAREGMSGAAMYLDSAATSLRSALLGFIGSQVR